MIRQAATSARRLSPRRGAEAYLLGSGGELLGQLLGLVAVSRQRG